MPNAILTADFAGRTGTLKYFGAVAGGFLGGYQGAIAGYNLGQAAQVAYDGLPDFTVEAQGRDQVVRSSVATRKIVYGRAMVSGPLVFSANSGSKNSTLWLVIALAGHEIDAVETVYLNETALPNLGDVTTGPYAGKVRVNAHRGNAGDPADADLIAANVGWTADHKLTGVAYIAVRLIWDQDVFPQGIPNCKALVRGRKLYDPRTGTTVWSANSALVVRDYHTASFGLEASASEIDDALVIAAANICDEQVAILPTGTESRYTANGVLDTVNDIRPNMLALLSSMAGYSVDRAGQHRIYAGAYTAPAVTLTADDLAGPVRVRPRISRKDLFNAVRGTFVDPAAYWQPTDYPGQSNATYATQDGNQVIWRDMSLPFTTSSATAQRIAKLMLERSRQGITVEMPCNLNAFKIASVDTVMVTLPQLGWSAKEFKVMDWRFSQEGGVNLVLQEESAASYSWNNGMQTVDDPAPDTNLPNPFSVVAPGAPSITENLYETTGSAGVKSRAVVSWAAVDDAFVVGYLVDYKLLSDSTYDLLPQVRGTSLEIPDLAPGSYQFRVRAVNSVGVRSAYSPVTTKELVGLTAPPANVSNFTVTKVGGVAIGAWQLSPDLDVRIGGRIVIRHSPLTTGATWADGVVLEEFGGDTVTGLLPLITGTYMAKAKDSTATYSTAAANFVATEGLVTGFTTVATSIQDPTFSGTKTGTTVISSALQLGGALLFDSVAGNFDSAAGVFDTFGQNLTGSYEFATYLDLTTVATRRVEADIKAVSFDLSSVIDDKTALIDTWNDFDGIAVDDCDATLFYSATNDNPAGSPVWGPWTPFFVADVTSRALKFKLDLISGDSAHNISVSTLRIDVKIP
jgi:hypothetical protein